jgi:hypothetical protein
VGHQEGIAPISNQRREPVGNPHLPLGGTEQHHPTI